MYEYVIDFVENQCTNNFCHFDFNFKFQILSYNYKIIKFNINRKLKKCIQIHK